MNLDIVNKAHLIKINKLPFFHHKHLKSQLKLNVWLMLKVLIAIIQEHRWIR